MKDSGYLYTSLLCYLKPGFYIIFSMMVERGMDPDLALAVIETLCGLDTIYEIPNYPEESNIAN